MYVSVPRAVASVTQSKARLQTVYYAAKPIPIPKGTKIVVTAYFDNSSENKYSPDPTRAVRFGDPTYDEMMVGLVEYTVDGKSVKASTAMDK